MSIHIYFHSAQKNLQDIVSTSAEDTVHVCYIKNKIWTPENECKLKAFTKVIGLFSGCIITFCKVFNMMNYVIRISRINKCIICMGKICSQWKPKYDSHIDVLLCSPDKSHSWKKFKYYEYFFINKRRVGCYTMCAAWTAYFFPFLFHY